MNKLPKPNSVIMAVHDYHWGNNRVHRETSRAVVDENGAMSYDFWNGSGGIQPEHLISWEYIEHSKIEELEERIQQLTDELKWLQDNHVRVCSRKSKLDLRIQQLETALGALLEIYSPIESLNSYPEWKVVSDLLPKE